MTPEEYLKDCIQPDGGLYKLGWYLGWAVNQDSATLDGRFTAEDLEQIAAYMRAHLAPACQEGPD